jgi:hypothetical protein
MGFNPTVDLTRYNFGSFVGNRLMPESPEAMRQAELSGEAAANAPAAGMQAAEDIAAKPQQEQQKQEQQKKADQEARRKDRFKQLVDYFRPKSAEERMIEADARNRAQDEREKQKMAMDRELIAQGAVQDFEKRLAGYQQQPVAPLVELGKNVFGLPIMTNKPASTAQEQAARVEKFNLTPGSVTQFAMGGLPAGASPEEIAAGQDRLTTESVSQMMQDSLKTGQAMVRDAESGWIYDRALGRYVKGKRSTPQPVVQPGTTIPTGSGFFNVGRRTLR